MTDYKYWVLDDASNDAQMGIFWLKLNRPDKTNAFNEEMALELGEILDGLLKNEDLRILVLGSTTNNFSAGADIDWFARISGEEAEQVSIRSHEIFGKLRYLYKGRLK